MKKYEITTEQVGGYPIKSYSEPETIVVEAENTEDLIIKMGWKVDEDHERYDWSCEVVKKGIEDGYSFFYREDEECYDDELYIWDGENADGTRIDVEILSDDE